MCALIPLTEARSWHFRVTRKLPQIRKKGYYCTRFGHIYTPHLTVPPSQCSEKGGLTRIGAVAEESCCRCGRFPIFYLRVEIIPPREMRSESMGISTAIS